MITKILKIRDPPALFVSLSRTTKEYIYLSLRINKNIWQKLLQTELLSRPDIVCIERNFLLKSPIHLIKAAP